ncbi:MAG TPA: hypothetical protein VN911_05045 [Candidatus Acidoferrum sp.]|nr:hypothetical protein [Candidatus Acidoferrum sp.]
MKNAKAVGKKSYSKPTVTKLTQEQAKKFIVDRTDCGDQEATKVLESLMAGYENLSAKQTEDLTEELAVLAKLQLEALQTAAYINMSKAEAAQYDKRAVRIGEICGRLGKSSQTPKTSQS